MTPQELIQITGQHLLFLGVPTFSWQLSQFQQAAQFAKAHGVDNLLVKTHDGTNAWYGNIGGWSAVRSQILAEGVGAIPYTYSYGDKFGALDTEIDILIAHMQDTGIVCMDAEAEWNGQTSWAEHLCQRMRGILGAFMVSTWADPSLQDWQGVIAALDPCTLVWMPQQYNNYLATFWQEFAANGATWLQPTVDLTQDFGANDPVAIASTAHSQGHTAISVWYYDTATQNVTLLDQVYEAFPKGGQNVNAYGPNSTDFNDYFTVDANGNWVCKQTNAAIIGGNKGLFSEISIDGNTLPVIGLPRTNELYQQDSDGYHWSVQFFERGVIVYDPEHKRDGQPGCGASYFGKPLQFLHLDPAYQPPQPTTAIPDTVVADIQAVKDASDKLAIDANVVAMQKVAVRLGK